MSDVIINVLQAVFAFALVLAPLVFIHEFGHFIVAKWLGIGVPVFSLGFGPRLLGFTRGGTDYRISAIPLGGYVRLAGDEADETRTGAPEEFLSRPKWERFAVFVAGAVFNVALALVVMWMLFAIFGKDEVRNPDSYPWVAVVEEGSNAAAAGILEGDVLIEIAGRDLKGYEKFAAVYNDKILLSPETEQAIAVKRDDVRVDLVVNVSSDPTQGHGLDPGWGLAWGGDQVPLLDVVLPDSRAEEAGLEGGDIILGVGEREPIGEREFRQLIEANAEHELVFTVERAGERLSVAVVPANESGRGRIGVTFPVIHRDLSLTEAARESWRVNVANSVLLFKVLKKMVTREVPLKTVSGPIGIAQYARRALWASPRDFLWLLGFFSLQLGILNLLPIPVLDGGHILILGVEGVLGRDLSDGLKERVMQVGFVFLLAFMGIVIVLDIVKL